METGTYLKASAVNLLFLVAGLLISPAIVHTERFFAWTVQAQSKEKGTASKVDQTASSATPAPVKECEGYECLTASISTGTAAFHTILAHRIASDHLMVNGYDPMKLTDGILVSLQVKGILTRAELERIVSNAKVPKPLRLQPPKEPQK